MRKNSLVIVTLVCAFALVGAGFASASDDTKSAAASASAEIMTALTIHADQGLQFGKIAPSPSDGSATVVTISAASSAVRTLVSGDGMLVAGTTPEAAKFTVSGDSDLAFTLHNDSNSTFDITHSEDSMTVSNLTFSDVPGTLSLSSGTKVIYVGGKLTVPAGQAKASYTASGITLSVVYN